MGHHGRLMGAVQHLYAHVPFCAHRCGYCDFTTVTGHDERHAAYVDALGIELAARGGVLADPPETVYLGGGTPSRLGPDLLGRLLDGLPRATGETTVECNPEDVDDALAAMLAARGCRVSLGAQTFARPLLEVLERRTTPDGVRDAVGRLRAAGVPSLSLDLIYGIPGQSEADLARDLAVLEELAPDHVSAYELEAKPGTRFTVHHGGALAEQAERLERHMDLVIDLLEAAGYDWYEVASFARGPAHRAVHNTAYWRGRDYLGLGIGAVSTLAGERRTNGPKLAAYLADPAGAPAALEPSDADTALRERVMLGLRLADGVELDGELAAVLDPAGVERLVALGLARSDGGTLRLERRGRMLLHACVAEILG
jgi:oxygen-independent coproporphyrinogen-3 oxidase